MEIAYYPGCTLKTNAKEFEETAIKAFAKLSITLKELKKWYCCGTVYSLTTDNLMYRLAAIRSLVKAREEGYNKLTTFCSVCHNTLKQANQMAVYDKEAMKKVNSFMDEEAEYDGSVEVIHPLEILKGMKKEIREKVASPLKRKYAAYYGCLLLRPKEVAINQYGNPRVMEELLETLGGEAVNFPFRNECCGSYNIAGDRRAVVERTYRIVGNAIKNGASAIINSCPLCSFNLKETQETIRNMRPDFVSLPVYYFTEVMAEALQL